MESKVKPNLLLIVVKYGLDVVWYLSFVSIFFMVIVIATKKDRPNSNVEHSVYVKYSGELKQSYTSYYDTITSVEFRPTHGELAMKGKLPLFNMVWVYIAGLTMFALFVFFLFNMRKLFTSFLRHTPFCMDNVKRIRVLSYCFVVLNLLQLAWERHIIYEITSFSSFSPLDSRSFPGDYTYHYFIIALVIYVFADVFKYGVQLQEENNKFV